MWQQKFTDNYHNLLFFYYFFNTTNIQQLIYNRKIIEQYNFNIIFETEREKPKSTAQDYNE